MWGKWWRWECLSSSDMRRPNVIPSNVLRRKDIKKIPIPWKIDPR